jgi:AcrR family transcriptional regulator
MAERRVMTALERRQEILDKAAVLFDSGSYNLTSMDDIAASVGIAKPTLYHYFTSKGEILFDIHEELIDKLLVRHQDRLAKNLRPRDSLLEIMEDILMFMQTRPGHMRVFFEHYRELPLEQREIIRVKREQFQAILQQVLADGIRLGDFRDFDVRLTSFEIFGACIWAYQWYLPGGRLVPHEIARQFWNNLVNGIGVTAP